MKGQIHSMLAADGKFGEAIPHYQRYLKLEPSGDHAARARERLQRVQKAKQGK